MATTGRSPALNPPRNGNLAKANQFKRKELLAHRSHNNGEICYAIFDRISPGEFDPGPVSPFVDHKDRVDAMMELYGAVFDTSLPIPPI